MKIRREWAMPNKWTFTIKPFKEIIKNYMFKFDEETWVDPFAGMHSPAHYRNDLREEANAENHLDALEFLKLFEDESVIGVFFDPPYSVRQVSECYKGCGMKVTQKTTRVDFYSKLKNEITRIVKPGGIVMSWGWNSMGMGKTRGFTKLEILLVAHGGHKNDTILVVEQKEKV